MHETEATTITSRRVSKCRGRRVAEAVDFVIYRAVFFDIGVAGGEVRLGLVVVVVTDEVLDPVFGEHLSHLVGDLSGERLVGLDDKRGPLHLLDRPGDGGALAAPRDAEERLKTVTPVHARGQAFMALGWSPAGDHSETTLKGGTAVIVPGGCASKPGDQPTAPRAAEVGKD